MHLCKKGLEQSSEYSAQIHHYNIPNVIKQVGSEEGGVYVVLIYLSGVEERLFPLDPPLKKHRSFILNTKNLLIRVTWEKLAKTWYYKHTTTDRHTGFPIGLNWLRTIISNSATLILEQTYPLKQ